MKLFKTGVLLVSLAGFSAGAFACGGDKHADAEGAKMKCAAKHAKSKAEVGKKQVKKNKSTASPAA
jgi:hypothetical protein